MDAVFKRPEKCHCGSGKKFEKCCDRELKRDRRVFGIWKEGELPDKTDENDGLITLFKNGKRVIPAMAELQYGYVRKGKPHKIISTFPVKPELITNIGNYHLANFAPIIACDTNTVEISGRKVSVGTTASGNFKIDEKGNPFIKFTIDWTIEFWNESENEEIRMWEFVLKTIERYKYKSNVAFIVDTFQPHHTALNAGLMPVFGNYRLPKNVFIMYASSDTGGEFFGNKMIRACDKVSTNLIKHLRANPKNYDNLFVPDTDKYSAFRYWKTKVTNDKSGTRYDLSSYPPPPIVKCKKYIP